MDTGGHTTQVRQERAQIDTGLLKTDELARHHRPVRARHQLGEDVVAEDAAQLAGRPAWRRLLRVLIRSSSGSSPARPWFVEPIERTAYPRLKHAVSARELPTPAARIREATALPRLEAASAAGLRGHGGRRCRGSE
ncbi:hypothetical protein ACFWSP_22550 [Streptomyces sp. NPDC058618]|uniref:hypothetical protein n=1 Tax=unclassified Streptomyces TaxID=2593676 RepID=UPI0036563E51